MKKTLNKKEKETIKTIEQKLTPIALSHKQGCYCNVCILWGIVHDFNSKRILADYGFILFRNNTKPNIK